MLSLKLALRNLQKSKSSFLPFLIASVTMFVMLFVVTAMSISPTVSKLPGGDAVSQLLIFAMIILAIFSGIILIYSYRFLQLQRSKEFGLYDILGFGKGRIMSVSSLELLFSFLMTVAIGSLVGVALSKVLFLIFVRMIGGKYFDLVLSPQAFGIVIFVFAVIFLLLLIQGAFIIWK
ncbi:MAG: ABC transporter permease, partial [Streptococcaceae bacterium]|nr:ABC transporter permease [Streptococcaceae bacterium]